MRSFLFVAALLSVIVSCNKDDNNWGANEIPEFTEIATLDIGETGAAEISAYDPATQKLFVVNNGAVNKIDVIDFINPASPALIKSIELAPYGGAVNSLSVSDGKLAAAIESLNKQQNGKVVIFKTSDYSEVKVISVGALPDMITYSPDGKYILTANEGEPDNTYTNDPIGTVSIISVKDNYAVVNLDFASFASQKDALTAKGLRIFGPNASFAQDIEPEYIAVSDDSRTAWVTLQENNAIAKIDIRSKTITAIFPLGFKDHNNEANAFDPSDRDNTIALAKQKTRGLYLPDAIAFMELDGQPLLFTANEGDVREYAALTENKRIKDLSLDATAFPDASAMKKDDKLGRLNVTTTLGDTDKDGDFDILYSFGSRSFSVWHGNQGLQVFDSKTDLEQRCITENIYDDGRSDDKGVEPEGLALGKVGKTKVAFIGLERADAIVTYEVSNPYNPIFLQVLKCGDAPEGVLFISAKDSPTKKSLLVVSSENDGVIKVFSTK